jgi:hypothetical protein
MKYYIVKKEPGNLQIIKVQDADVQNFLEDYGGYVLAAGDSIACPARAGAEALQNFNPPQNE